MRLHYNGKVNLNSSQSKNMLLVFARLSQAEEDKKVYQREMYTRFIVDNPSNGVVSWLRLHSISRWKNPPLLFADPLHVEVSSRCIQNI